MILLLLNWFFRFFTIHINYVSDARCNIKPSFIIDINLLWLSYKYGFLKPEMHCPCLTFLLHWFMYVCVCFIVFCFIFKYSRSLLILRLQCSWWFEPFENLPGLCWFFHYMLGKYNFSGGKSLWTWYSYDLNFRFEMFQCYRTSDDYLCNASSCLQL